MDEDKIESFYSSAGAIADACEQKLSLLKKECEEHETHAKRIRTEIEILSKKQHDLTYYPRNIKRTLAEKVPLEKLVKRTKTEKIRLSHFNKEIVGHVTL